MPAVTSSERTLGEVRELILARRLRGRRPARRGRAGRAARGQPDAGARGAVPAGRRGPGRDRAEPRRPGEQLDGGRAGGRVRPAGRAGAAAHRAGRAAGRRPRTSPRSTSWPARCSTVGSPGPGQDLDALVPLNREFHGRLVALADQPAMASALAGAVHAPIVLRNFHTYDDASLRRSLAHHVEIVAAIRAGDPAWAQAVMTAHIHNARAVMVRAARARQRGREAMSYRLGVDVGGTFTDVLLVRGGHRRDLAGQDRLHAGRPGRRRAHRDRQGVRRRPGSSRRDGRPRCCTAPRWPPTRSWRARAPRSAWSPPTGFRQVLQIARSYVPGGLAGWIIWPKPEPLAALENTVEVDERLASDGTRDPGAGRGRRARPAGPAAPGSTRWPSSLINSFADPRHERRIAELAAEVLPGVPVSLSSRRAARAARVRAHRDHRRQRLRAAAGQALRRDAGRAAARRRGGRRAGHPAQRRRAVRGRRRGRPRR